MHQPLNVELASRIGIRTTLVASYLWNLYDSRYPKDSDVFNGRRWVRMGQRTLTLRLPYLTRHTARFELRRLRSLGIIRAQVLSDNRFDRTNWYTFTRYGDELMKDSEFDEYD